MLTGGRWPIIEPNNDLRQWRLGEVMPEETKERPMLFNGAMVRAILGGQKTVTRRLVPEWQRPSKTYDDERWISVAQRDPRWGFGVFGETEEECMANYSTGYRTCCPFGAPGDRLWVRETFADLRGTGIEHRPDPAGPLQRYAFAADSPPGSASDEARKDFGVKWKPSIHMPRIACRILLEITAVRVERLQDITNEQCIAEGCRGGHGSIPGYIYNATPQEHFRHIWESTGGDYFANPWVWVVEFKRVTP